MPSKGKNHIKLDKIDHEYSKQKLSQIQNMLV